MSQVTAEDPLTAQYSSILNIGETVIKRASQKYNQKLLLTNLRLLRIREGGPMSKNCEILSDIPLDMIGSDSVLELGGPFRPDTLVISIRTAGRSETYRFELPKASNGKEWVDYIGKIIETMKNQRGVKSRTVTASTEDGAAVVSNLLKLMKDRHSSRVPFDQERPVAKQDLKQILEAARWAPTAHNMQNFEILVIDDKELLEKIGNVRSEISQEFLKENYQQLSFSEEELLQKKVGLLATMFPPSWRAPSAKLDEAIQENGSSFVRFIIGDSPVLLLVIYDSRKRAPASRGDVLGIMSLGCVMENMWLVAQDLGIAFQIISVLNMSSVEREVKEILNIPEFMRIAFACRLGYLVSAPDKYLRVRRDLEGFAHRNQFGNKGLN